MMIVRLDKTKEVTITTTGQKIARIEVTELSLNKKYPVTVWLRKNDWVFNPGDELEMDIREGKPFRGEKQYSANFESISPVLSSPIFAKPHTEIPPTPEGVAPIQAEEILGDGWKESFEHYKALMEVYKPTQAGDLKEIAKMSGFQV